MTIPAIHRIAATGITICNGFALSVGAGVNDSATTGLTASLTIVIPELIAGSGCRAIFAGIVSLLGIKLRTLSNEKGHISRMATSPQRRHGIHFGAFFSINLVRTTARISQLAVMLIFRTLRNTALMLTLPF